MARLSAEKHIVISVHLGSDQLGRDRKRILEAIALASNHTWDEKPSIGRWLIAVADKELERTQTQLEPN